MEVLASSVKAYVPLIAVQTDDPVNADKVIEHLTGVQPVRAETAFTSEHIAPNTLYYQFNTKMSESAVKRFHSKLLKSKSSFIAINPSSDTSKFMFDAGALPVPTAMAKDFLMKAVADETRANDLLAALGGCNLREMGEISRIAMVEYKAFTPQAVGAVRRSVFTGSQGLTPVQEDMTLYVPSAELENFAKVEKQFFFQADKPEFQPRGLLFAGPPGTGKSSAAKYVANTWGIPLYRLSMGDVKHKYVGSSQGNLRAALSKLDRQEPAVVLIDEVEKSINVTGYSSDTETDMLGSLLWWLAEHTSKVFTVLTTNNKDIIPKELFRPGRIDKIITLQGVTRKQSILFLQKYAKAIGYEISKNDADALAEYTEDTFGFSDGTVSYAALKGALISSIKNNA